MTACPLAAPATPAPFPETGARSPTPRGSRRFVPPLAPRGPGGLAESTGTSPGLVSAPRALVVFADTDKPGWLRLLRPGFRHVFVALNDGRHWVTVDPLAPHTDVVVQEVAASFDLAAWFRAQGLVVVPATLTRCRRPAPWAPFTCVEAVKRVLGLRAPWVLTPFQLYRHLALRPQPQE